MPIKDVRIVEIPGETGVCFQHLAILIGRETRAGVWPGIVSRTDLHADPRAPLAEPSINED